MSGPLDGMRVLEVGGIGPVPHAGMMLADLGADLVRVEGRPKFEYSRRSVHADATLRGRRSIVLDLKSSSGLRELLDFSSVADVLLEGYRPGVAEKLGFGPDVCRVRNPGLIYVRITGWGQEGPRAHEAGHDINYLAIMGTLHAMGHSHERPLPPLNLLGDFGGGSLLALVGILAAAYDRQTSGLGQTVDVAMVDGIATLSQMIWSMRGMGL